MKTVTESRRGPARYAIFGVALASVIAAVALIDSSVAQTDHGTARQEQQAAAPHFAAPGAGERSFADVFQEVSPAVVTISIAKIARPMPTLGPSRGGQSPFDDFFGQFFGVPGQMQQPRRLEGQGSGFIIDSSGYIATNNHVVDGAEEIKVKLASGEEFNGTVVGTDPDTDLALVKIDPDEVSIDGPLPTVHFGDSDKTRVGDWVLAIGNPFGLGGTATAGIVSARGRDIASGPYDDYLQIDAPINAGNSGGPVFNAAGEVVGINTAIYSPNGGNIGIGFAIPSNEARMVLNQLEDGGAVTRGWLGVQIQPVDKDLAQVLDLPEATGALVAEVVDAGPAAAGGVQIGDVITALDGKAIDSPRDLARTVALRDVGDKVKLEVIRDGHHRTLAVTLGKRDEQNQVASAGQPGKDYETSSAADLGLVLENLDAQTRNQLGLGDDVRGAVVANVEPGSEAERRGLQPGDVIVSVNRQATPDAEAALSALAVARREDKQALVLVRRQDGQYFVALGKA